jgi:hypothetical protein
VAGEPFKVTVEGPGTNVTREIKEEVAFHIIAMAFGNKGGLGPAGPASGDDKAGTKVGEQPPNPKITSKVSIGEFMADLKIDSNVERIAAVALYARDVLGQSRIEKSEITDWFQRAGHPAPKNLPRDIQSAIKKRLIAEDNSETGLYFVTATGEKELRASG